MRTPYDVILAPIITENSMDAMAQRKYTFRVAKGAGKIEIGRAVEAIFPGTKVAAVNTMSCRGRLKRMGRNEGRTPAWKKAIVTLTADSKGIEFFESMQ